jgi:hypothetical protein
MEFFEDWNWKKSLIAVIIIAIIASLCWYAFTPIRTTDDTILYKSWTWEFPTYTYVTNHKSNRSHKESGAYNVHRHNSTTTYYDTATKSTKTKTVVKYSYDIDEWEWSKDCTTTGLDNKPYEGEDKDLPFDISNPHIGDRKRGNRAEKYEVKTEKSENRWYEITRKDWEKLEVGYKIEYDKARALNKISVCY